MGFKMSITVVGGSKGQSERPEPSKPDTGRPEDRTIRRPLDTV